MPRGNFRPNVPIPRGLEQTRKGVKSLVNRRKSAPAELTSRHAPAKTPEDRENQIASLAFDLVEQRLRAGTASSQETIWALKLGSTREAIEKEKIRNENALLATKKEIMESQKAVEELYHQALDAMRAYSGQSSVSPEPDYDGFED